MSDEEREIEVVHGMIDSVVRKKEDTWQIVVKPEGSQYTKNLWTKNEEGVKAAEGLLGQTRYFVCNASYWKNQDGAQVRSLWVERMSVDAPEGLPPTKPPPKPGDAARSVGSGEHQKDLAPAAVERLERNHDHDMRSRAWAHTINALGPNIEAVDPSATDMLGLFGQLKLLQQLIYDDLVKGSPTPAAEAPQEAQSGYEGYEPPAPDNVPF